MAYPQFGYSYTTSSQLLVSNNQTGSPCCDANRPMITDPITGQTVCSCQYDSRAIGYSRLASTGAIYSTSYGDQTYPSISIEPTPLYGPLGNPYTLKESSSEMNGWPVTQPASYYSYDMSAYGYGSYDLNGARRKNATRETTSTLKAWLSEHKKNPYPTKGEKIMLAIITKMTLTQVSTWFANARRRLKKENKMTWEPKNKTSEDGDEDDDSDPEDGKENSEENGEIVRLDKEDRKIEGLDDKSSDYGSSDGDNVQGKSLDSPQSCSRLSCTNFAPAPVTCTPTKPKIWSLADTATCKTPPPPPPPAAPFQSTPVWVPSVGAFQVPSLSAHNSRSLSGTFAPDTDTPPQTPPNLKVPPPSNNNNGNPPDCQQETLNPSMAAAYPTHRNIVAAMTSRFQLPPNEGPGSTSHQQHAQSYGSQNSIYNNTTTSPVDMNTAFKPVLKRENPWT